jgi:hypothetical protein
MSFPHTTNEKRTLVPVIAMLLQFTKEELQDIEHAETDPTWNPKPVKELKRGGSTIPQPTTNMPPQVPTGGALPMYPAHVTKKWKTPPASPSLTRKLSDENSELRAAGHVTPQKTRSFKHDHATLENSFEEKRVSFQL